MRASKVDTPTSNTYSFGQIVLVKLRMTDFEQPAKVMQILANHNNKQLTFIYKLRLYLSQSLAFCTPTAIKPFTNNSYFQMKLLVLEFDEESKSTWESALRAAFMDYQQFLRREQNKLKRIKRMKPEQ